MALARKAAKQVTQQSFRERVRMHVFDTFGEEAKAVHWLNRRNPLFAGKTPAEALETDPESVEQELTRIDHGIFV
ncbi:MAG TPA: MbcA/ParS/Xre antitoxin family protein [Bryobacteraceae bacterium]